MMHRNRGSAITQYYYMVRQYYIYRVYKDHEGLGILAQNYLPKTICFLTVWAYWLGIAKPHFTGSTIMNVKKDAFLSNTKNKQSFIFLLSRFLQQVGCQVSHAKGDADMLIVQTAIESVSRSNTVLVGDDTDLLVLLCFHTSMNSVHEIFFKPEAKLGTHKLP